MSWSEPWNLKSLEASESLNLQSLCNSVLGFCKCSRMCKINNLTRSIQFYLFFNPSKSKPRWPRRAVTWRWLWCRCPCRVSRFWRSSWPPQSLWCSIQTLHTQQALTVIKEPSFEFGIYSLLCNNVWIIVPIKRTRVKSRSRGCWKHLSMFPEPLSLTWFQALKPWSFRSLKALMVWKLWSLTASKASKLWPFNYYVDGFYKWRVE